ncbi:YbhB/YbcL family Raf kinase inhibitor-like protein [Actinomadura fulvescens]|uniref:YbhB/YbcL family Raf kinase inhibitor-like protein n=1 Tax=Actinomadura fulvescens TaxID=46160 RepID=A0ABN3QK69_9ACTN
MIPAEYSHQNGDTPPPLEWLDVPEDVAELALICEDPDAPNGTFTHWALAAIPPDTGGIAADQNVPNAVSGRNDYGTSGYGGPQPPIGETHRYFFRLYGLSEPSGLADGFSADDLRAKVRDKAVASGTLVGTFGR